MITILSIIITVLSFSILFILRYFWFLMAFGTYIQWVKYYLYLNGKHEDAELFKEYTDIWPTTSIMIRIWNWRFRDFVVNQDLYDKIIIFMLGEIGNAKQ